MMKLKAAAVPQSLDLSKCVQNALWLYDASNGVPSAPFAWMEPQIPVSTYAYIQANQAYKAVLAKHCTLEIFLAQRHAARRYTAVR